MAHKFDRGKLTYWPKLGPTFVPQPFGLFWEIEKAKTVVTWWRRVSRGAGLQRVGLIWLVGHFWIVWLRSIVCGRLIFCVSGTIFLYIYITLHWIDRLLRYYNPSFSFIIFGIFFFLLRIYSAREIWSPPQDNSRGETHRGYLQTLGGQLYSRNWTSRRRRNSGDRETGVLWSLYVAFRGRPLQENRGILMAEIVRNSSE